MQSEDKSHSSDLILSDYDIMHDIMHTNTIYKKKILHDNSVNLALSKKIKPIVHAQNRQSSQMSLLGKS